MTDDLEILLRQPYAVEVVPDTTTDGELCYLASHPELPGCLAHGDTVQEALENLEDARRLYISALIERGEEVPNPQTGTSGIVGTRHEIIWEQYELREAPSGATSPEWQATPSGP